MVKYLVVFLCLNSLSIAFGATDSPSIASAAEGANAVAITSPAFPAGVNSASLAVFTVEVGKTCDTPTEQISPAPGDSGEGASSAMTTIRLTHTLEAGTVICARETFKDSVGSTKEVKYTSLVTVTSLEADWGRVRAYFVGGVLITNDSSSFSSAHQFYDLNVEKTWRLPHCYLQGGRGEPGCIEEDSSSTLDLGGGSMQFKHPIRISGGSANVGPPFALENVTISVTGDELIETGAGGIQLHHGQTFTIASGTLTGTLYPSAKIGAGMKSGTLKITKGQLVTAVEDVAAGNWLQRQFTKPGVVTYFETRLTSIPVASNATNTNCSSTGTTAGTTTSSSVGQQTSAASCSTTASSAAAAQFANAGTGSSSSSASSPSASFLTSQQTANVGVGVYLPFLVSRWDFKNTPNALFIAPIGKIGFNTITGASAQTVVLPSNGGTGTQNFEQIYNFYDYGFRVGHLGLSKTRKVAPELYSFLDFSLGRFSNLESLICHRQDQGGGAVSGTGCAAFGSQYTQDSRKRLYRIDIEGLLKIPNTVFYVGLNANIGQRQAMADKLDPNFAAPNDLRFLFGTKFDISQIFTKLGVK